MMFTKKIGITLTFLTFTLTSCIFKEISNDPIPYYSDQIKYNNLIVKVSFENNVTDEKGTLLDGVGNNITYVDGIKGKGYQGATNAYVAYNSVDSDKLQGLTSITVAFWVKTDPHTDGAQCLYMIPKNQSPVPFWGNSFILLEANSDTDFMPVKVHFEKNFSDGSVNEQWVDHSGTNAPQDVYGKWTHVAWTYDGVNSEYYFYINGQNITPDAFVERYNQDDYLGFLNFTGVDKFIIGGYQQQLGSPWSAPDSWMKTFTGAMDEFRIYDTALTAEDVFRLYSIEKEGL